MRACSILLASLLPLMPAQGQATRKLHPSEQKYPSGELKARYHYYVDASGRKVRHGLVTVWWPNGRKKFEARFRDGKPGGGVLRRWYENGQLLAEVEEDGTQGRELLWYESGQKKQVTTYRGDKMETTEWYPHGAKKGQCKLTGGNGVEYGWYVNGQMRVKRPMHQGQPHGTQECWDCKGRLLSKGTFANGQRQRGQFMRWASGFRRAVIETMRDGRVARQVHVVPLYDERADAQRVRKDQVSADPTYGYQKANPIKLGGGQLTLLGAGAEAERRYLRHLRTQALVPFDFHRVGSVGGIGEHLLDQYDLVSRDGKERATLYIDMYHKNLKPLSAKAPKGLTILSPTDTWQPSIERRIERVIREGKAGESGRGSPRRPSSGPATSRPKPPPAQPRRSPPDP